MASRVDRHANLGKGFIGKDGILTIYKLIKQHGINTIMETSSKYHDEDIKLLNN